MELAPDFWLLVDCLDDMAKRWAGLVARSEKRADLATKYSSQLRALHAKCNEDPQFALDVLGYATDGFPDQTARRSTRTAGIALGCAVPDGRPCEAAPVPNLHSSPEEHAAAAPVPASHLGSMLQPSPTNRAFEQHSQDELAAISTALMDQDFTQLDRVISFDDMSFTVPADSEDAPGLGTGNWTFG